MTISKNPQPNISKREQIIEEIKAHTYLLWISPTKETMTWANMPGNGDWGMIKVRSMTS